MRIEDVVMLVAGIAGFVGGVGILAFRKQLAERNRKNIEARLGKWLPGFAEGSTPGKMIGPGVGFVLIGASLIWRALAGLTE